MTSKEVTSAVLPDEVVFRALNQFWISKTKPDALHYIYVAGSAVNGGRLVRKKSQTLHEGDIDITYVTDASDFEKLQQVNDFIEQLKAFLQEQKRLGNMQFSDVHISSSRMLDTPLPERILDPTSTLEMFNKSRNIQQLAKTIVQLCMPTIPPEAGINNKLMVSSMLQVVREKDPEKYERLIECIKDEWVNKMRWKTKYSGENTKGEQFVQNDPSIKLAENLIRSLSE